MLLGCFDRNSIATIRDNRQIITVVTDNKSVVPTVILLYRSCDDDRDLNVSSRTDDAVKRAEL